MKKLNTNTKHLRLLFLMIIIFVFINISIAQHIIIKRIIPKQSITVTAVREINFGAFCVTGKSGGTITVSWDGSRTSTGGIVLLSIPPYAQPALFEIKLCESRKVIVTYNSIATLNGSNGGVFNFDIGPTEKGLNGCSFVLNNDCNFNTPLHVGGTLHIPASVIPGTYTGSFNITLNEE